MKRSRSEEAAVPMAFQESLVRQHGVWLRETTVPVLTVDGDREFEADPLRRAEVIEEIRAFIRAQRTPMLTPMRLPRPARTETLKRLANSPGSEAPSPKRRVPFEDTPSKLVRNAT